MTTLVDKLRDELAELTKHFALPDGVTLQLDEDEADDENCTFTLTLASERDEADEHEAELDDAEAESNVAILDSFRKLDPPDREELLKKLTELYAN